MINKEDKICYNCKYLAWLVGVGQGLKCTHPEKSTPETIPNKYHTCDSFEKNMIGFLRKKSENWCISNTSSWDEIYEEYSNENYPPFGGPFTNALSLIDWLKLNFNPPPRKN